jgi:hypothetical protein
VSPNERIPIVERAPGGSADPWRFHVTPARTRRERS